MSASGVDYSKESFADLVKLKNEYDTLVKAKNTLTSQVHHREKSLESFDEAHLVSGEELSRTLPREDLSPLAKAPVSYPNIAPPANVKEGGLNELKHTRQELAEINEKIDRIDFSGLTKEIEKRQPALSDVDLKIQVAVDDFSDRKLKEVFKKAKIEMKETAGSPYHTLKGYRFGVSLDAFSQTCKTVYDIAAKNKNEDAIHSLRKFIAAAQFRVSDKMSLADRFALYEKLMGKCQVASQLSPDAKVIFEPQMTIQGAFESSRGFRLGLFDKQKSSEMKNVLVKDIRGRKYDGKETAEFIRQLLASAQPSLHPGKALEATAAATATTATTAAGGPGPGKPKS